MAELSGRDKGERSNIILRATGGAECSNRGERVFKYTRPPLRSRDGVFAVELLLLTLKVKVSLNSIFLHFCH